MKSWIIALLLLANTAHAQMVEVQDEKASPAVGKERAEEYIKARQADRKQVRAERAVAQDSSGAPRFMAIHLGSFFTSQAYKWGDGDQDDRGKFNAGVTYRLGEWVNSMDFSLRMDYTTYSFDEGSASKIMFGTVVTFPDANSRFPLYFGVGAGLGFFVKQINSESALSLDYSILGGARFLDVFENVGFMVEMGLKNHIHLLSDGQFNGVFVNVGSVFAF